MVLLRIRIMLLLVLGVWVFLYVDKMEPTTSNTNGSKQLDGFWWIDETDRSRIDLCGPTPLPFYFYGDTVVLHFVRERKVPRGFPPYLRLKARTEAGKVYYLEPLKNHKGNYRWIQFAELEANIFFVVVAGKKLRYSRKTRNEVDPGFAGYFSQLMPYRYPTVLDEVMERISGRSDRVFSSDDLLAP